MPTKRDLQWRALEAGLPVASAVGQRERLLDQVVDRITDEHRIVDASIREFEYEGEPEGTILYPIVQGRAPVQNYMVCSLAHAFRARGYDPLVVLCDGALEMCMKKRRDGHDDARCDVCTRTGQRLFEAFGFEPVALSDLPGADPDLSVASVADPMAVTYEGVEISDFAVASTRNRLKRNEIDLDDPETRSLYDGLLRSAAHLIDATDALLDRYDVTHVVGNHPAYLYGGVPLATARERGLRCVTIMGGKRDRKLIVGYFEEDTPLPTYTRQEYLDEVLSRPLTDEQGAELDEMIAGRRDGSAVRYHYASDAGGSLDSAPTDATLVGVFSNLMWDASLSSKDITFADPYEWVVETLATLVESDDVAVVLKPHPAEVMRESNRRLDHWLQREHPDLVERIDLLPPDTDISPYALMDQIDACVVYSTNLALEMALDGVPAVVAADVHYRGNGFTFDPSGTEEYRKLLRSIDELEMTDEMRQRARRYAHLLWVRKHVDYPVYETASKDDFGSVRARPVSHDDLAPGTEHVDFIVDRVLADEPVVRPL